MPERESFALPMEGVAALQAHAYARTFGLLLFKRGVSRPDDGLDGATGVGVQLGHRFFVATAAHNICGIPDEGLVLVHEDRVSHNPTPFLRRWPGADDPDPTPDVGYIELDREVAGSSPKRFVPLDQIEFGFKRVGVHAVLAGHPVERVPKKPIRDQRIVNLRAMAFATRTVALPEDRDTNRDFALAFHESGTNVDTGEDLASPNLVGVSGAGVWTFPRPSPAGIWSPEIASLVGIEYAWKRDAGQIYCVQMQHWLALVARDYPDLRSEIMKHSDLPRATRAC